MNYETVAAVADGADKSRRVAQYAPLVKKMAHLMVSKLPASVQVDDLIQAGLIGLLDALNNYDSSHGAVFETYAIQRIRGAMLDELRELDWLPRSARKNMRQIETTVTALEQRLGRHASEAEVAQAMSLSLEEYQQMLLDARGHQLLYYEDFRDNDDDEEYLDRHCSDQRPSPFEQIQDEGFRRALAGRIDALPEREKLVLALYYDEELNLREIGAVLGVSESRVCQLHTQAVSRLRAGLADWLDK